MLLNLESYIKNLNFEVKMGLFSLSFSKITSISASAEYEAIGSGGENDRMYFLNKPKRSPDTIVFERGLKLSIADGFYSLIYEGVLISNITIVVKQQGLIHRMFWIDQGIVTKKSFGDLDAVSGALLIRSMELAHTGLVEIAI